MNTVAPTATIPLVEAPVQQLTGTGKKAPPPVMLTSGLITFHLTHGGKSNFIVHLLDSNANLVEGLVNVIGVFDGGTAVRIPKDGQYLFNVEADGPWTIAMLQPGRAEQANAVVLPQTFHGSAPAHSPLIASDAGALRLEMKHNGSGNFIVHVLDSKGTLIDGAANEIGAFDGAKTVRLPRKDTYMLVVEANGPWSIVATH